MKTSILTSASLSLLYLFSFVQSIENDHLQSLLSDPKFKPNTLGNVIPGRYIIEFDQSFHGSSLDFVNDIESDIVKSYPTINSRIKMSIAHDYDSDPSIFRGISISLQQLEDQSQFNKRDENDMHIQALENTLLRKILQQNRVKHIYPVVEIQRPKVENLITHNIKAYDFDDRNNVTPAIPQLLLDENGPSLPFSHTMTQVDKVVSDLKLKGKGVVVGIIDSGIDYRHPAFGGGFGPGFQVRYGYDLVGSRFNSRNPYSRRQSETPLDDCLDGNGHGTHVAGIIAANDKFFNFTGVAPEVTLGAWRVFGCDGTTSNDLVIKALISAHEAGCDVINLSLGGPSNWAEDPTALIANRISEKGSIVIAAAGNDGAKGAFYISSPGSGLSNIAVASIDNVYNLQQSAVTEEGSEYPYLLSSTTKTFPAGQLVNYINEESNADACFGTRPDNDLRGKIALVQRGKCTFDEKADIVRKNGGAGIVVYDNQDETIFKAEALTIKIPMASVTLMAGKELKRLINTNTRYKDGLHIEFRTALTPHKVSSGNRMSRFSSVGPLYDMTMKPDFAGPGGFIFSTLPISNGGYGMLSGTSMAAPYIAGAYALYIQAHGREKSANYLKEHFQNYAKPALQGDDIDTPIRQGAGLIQLFDTINQPIHVSPGHISFNDTVNYKAQNLTICNPGNDTVTFKIMHNPSLAVAPFNTRTQGFAPLQPPHYAPDNVQAVLNISESFITIGPGQTKKVRFEVAKVLGIARAEVYPMYGGYIKFSPVNSTTAKSIHVPYIGISGSLAKLPIFDVKFPRFMVINGTKLFEHKLQDGTISTGFIIDRSNRSSSFVTTMFRLLTGSAMIKTEVLDQNLNQIGMFTYEEYLTRNTLEDLDFIFAQRWNGTMIPNGIENLGDSVSLKPGVYHLRWKGLKLMSDPKNPDSWETRVSPPVLIRN
ncbi:peptidase S8/S53 domain-containing protein [Thamnidium elegans]|uniref:Minor extracellular protease vpr n=1 Tax=Thamnidium elegans TaxID=101142 RepID=A0A8H7VZF9_9FUNG|nr:hypothetical protein INT48_005692 [Thamnidium elegans]KAI8073604.1 peptidase S8/S53 domain-containing protein [Thamnidium elegans]